MGMIERAKIKAMQAHINQKRKYTGEPYFVHLQEVASIIESIGGSNEQIAAAYLHDIVEDTPVTLEEIWVEFGSIITGLVEALTDVSKLSDGNRVIRKQIDLEHTAKASPEAKTIKLADIISNTSSIVEYDKDFAKVFLYETERILHVLIEGDSSLYKRASDLLIESKLILMDN